jgi:hypothetical protein
VEIASNIVGNLKTEIAMTTFKINLTTEEAAQIVAALGFVRRNLAVNTKTMKWTFVPGQVIEYDLAAIINLEDIISRFNESIEESIETSPFHPYVVDF